MAEEKPIERRRLHAFVLREFFEEQWTHLMGLLTGPPTAEGGPEPAELEQALESLVEGTDARVRLILNYRKRLRSGVRSVLEQVEQIVAQLPPAQPINRQGFAEHPLLNTLFTSPDDLQRTLSASSEIQSFLSSKGLVGRTQGYALLMATPCEKRILGMALSGDMLMRDVVQTALNFCDRRVEHPAVDEQEVRRSLERSLYGAVVHRLRGRMAEFKAQSEAAACALNSPQGYLDRLSSLLEQPQTLICLETRRLRVSKRGGVLVGEATADEPVNEFTLDELVLADAPRQLLLLVCYPVSELLDRDSLYGEALRGLGF